MISLRQWPTLVITAKTTMQLTGLIETYSNHGEKWWWSNSKVVLYYSMLVVKQVRYVAGNAVRKLDQVNRFRSVFELQNMHETWMYSTVSNWAEFQKIKCAIKRATAIIFARRSAPPRQIESLRQRARQSLARAHDNDAWSEILITSTEHETTMYAYTILTKYSDLLEHKQSKYRG